MFAPDWTRAGLPLTWPVLVAILILLGCLVAITLVDAKTFTIPLVLAWVPAIVGLVAHVGLAVYLPLRYTEMPTLENLLPGSLLRWGGWTMATPGPHGWLWVGAALGGMVGLALSNVLLWKGLIRRSYADYEAWEAQAKAEAQAEKAEAEKAAQAEASVGTEQSAKAQPADESPADYWIQYPYARREAGKELVFLAPVAALGAAGAALAVKLAGPMTWDAERMQMVAAHAVPLWLNVLAGVLLGYLIGGGVVWLVRIAGTLAFNKDAMGLGDVHIMAAVGAVMGWLDATLAFFLAAFVGLAVEIVSRLAAGKSGLRRAIPYGPSLAIASVLVLLFKPLIELGLTKLSGASAPINLP
ncbi:MAG: A24 family peptidase [Planctomycetota bacterium]|nr:A24 family peptidase [Planctomycetota bacterium]